MLILSFWVNVTLQFCTWCIWITKFIRCILSYRQCAIWSFIVLYPLNTCHYHWAWCWVRNLMIDLLFSMQLGSYDWHGFQVMLTYPLYMEFQVSLTCHGRVLLFLINPYIWVFHWCECLNGNVQKPGYWFSLSLSFLLISICSEISFELVYYLRKGLFFLFLKIVSIYIKQE